MNKKEKIEKILHHMRKLGVSVEDLTEHAQGVADNTPQPKADKKFDMMVGQRRIPYAEAKKSTADIEGIFPFKDSNCYLDLSESPVERKCDDLSRWELKNLPHLDFYERIFDDGLVEPLNKQLQEFGAPILDGLYHVFSTNGYTVRFQPGDEALAGDYYGSQATGKVRLCGKIKN